MIACLCSDAELEIERKHYCVMCALADNRFDAIQYLYGKLGVIDAKTGSLLQVDGVLFAIITFMTSASFVLASDGNSIANLARTAHALFPGMLAPIFILSLTMLAMSTALCFWIFSLRFDHIANSSSGLQKVLVEKGNSDAAARAERVEAMLAPEAANVARRVPGSLEHYEDNFFRIIIQRQKLLRFASWLSGLSGALLALAYLDYLVALARLPPAG